MLVLWDPLASSLTDFSHEILSTLNEAKLTWRHHKAVTPPVVEEGDFVVAMGAPALEALAEAGITPKNRTVYSLRYPMMWKLNGADLMVTYSPQTRFVNYQYFVAMQTDLNLVIRRLTTGSFDPRLGEYNYVLNFDVLIKDIEEQYAATGKPVHVAFDTETLGLNCYRQDAYIISLQFCCTPGVAYVAKFTDQKMEKFCLRSKHIIGQQLRWLLTTDKISTRGANLKYDLNWLRYRHGIRCTNFNFDTMLVGSLLDENRGNSLNLHTKVYVPELGGYDDHLNRKYDKGRMDLVPDEDFLPYAAGDVDACLRVSKRMVPELMAEKRLARFYVKVLHPAARAYEEVEHTGLLVDVPYYLELENEIKAEMAALEGEALELLPQRLQAKHVHNMSLTKASLIQDYMFGPLGLKLKPKMATEKAKISEEDREKGRIPIKAASTSMDHLNMFADDERVAPFIRIVREWASAAKTLNTYVCKKDSEGNIIGGFLHHIRPDNRFHATYFLWNGGEDDGGTNTGRLSVRDPAVQTVPKHTKWAKRLRRAFIAPPGMVLMANDYSQGELKIAACLAREPRMIEAYLAGIDLHAVTAASLSGIPLAVFLALKETDPEKFEALRFLGKAGNFGLIYGMGAEGFQEYAFLNYGVRMTITDAEDKRDTFLYKTYPGLPKWHEEYKGYARQHMRMVSPLGRVRHLPLMASKMREVRAKCERQSINAPVQSTLSDMSLWSTSIIHRNGWFDESPVVAMIHDQLISYVPEDRALECAARNKDVMENLPFHELGWHPQLKFTVDAEVGQNLGDMKKVKL